jgi:serine O-acetyltransferase
MASDISAEIPDWSREQLTRFWDPGKQLLLSIRRYQYWKTKGWIGIIPRKIMGIRYRFWSVISGADIALNCRIGGGLLLPHPNGIVISSSAIIGVNCLIFQQVTIGTRRSGGTPVIGGHVDIGAGAKILGSLTIAPHSQVRANAVVWDWTKRAETHDCVLAAASSSAALTHKLARASPRRGGKGPPVEDEGGGQDGRPKRFTGSSLLNQHDQKK